MHCVRGGAPEAAALQTGRQASKQASNKQPGNEKDLLAHCRVQWAANSMRAESSKTMRKKLDNKLRKGGLRTSSDRLGKQHKKQPRYHQQAVPELQHPISAPLQRKVPP